MQANQVVTRLFNDNGSLKEMMKMRVVSVEDDIIRCVPHECPDLPDSWTFCRKTGAEIDHELQWGPMYGATGTFIKELMEETPH